MFVSKATGTIKSLLFADDLATISDIVVHFQNQITHIKHFCDSTGMQFHLQKSKIIIFRRGGTHIQCEKWFFKGQTIETVNSNRYIGSYFTPTLNWTKKTHWPFKLQKLYLSQVGPKTIKILYTRHSL